MLLGLNTEKETWEISAFRFDAPYGQALNVEQLNLDCCTRRRGLHRYDPQNTTLFLTVDLSGEATQVDIELTVKFRELREQ